MGIAIFGVDISGDDLEHYDDEELAYLNDHLGEFEAVTVEYRAAPCIRNFLQQVLPGLNGYLDTNFSKLVSYRDVLLKFEQEPDWDWRHW